MKPEHQKYFDAILDTMPDKAGYDKWVCGALYHVDPHLARAMDKCPQCGRTAHPDRGYKLKVSAK